jgi:outer membrane protein assembly factor BamD
MIFRIIIICLLSISLYSCQKKKEIIYEPQKKISAFKLYEEGFNAFEKNDFFYASKKFSEAELNFENIELAAKSAIMAAYSLYGINFYEESLKNLENYLKIYPADQNVIYAHFLIAVIYFEQISDEKKDINPLLKAKNKIKFFLDKYPNTDYAIDLKFKNDLIENQLASKEMYIAKYYISVKKWVPAINRLKTIVKEYEKTIFIEEALHRLVEIHYHLGLEEEAKKYASILGYNYNSGDWFKQSYKILNKDYKISTKMKISDKKDKDKKSFIKKIIKIIK